MSMLMRGEPTIPYWTPGDRLRKARELTGLTQEEFAKEVGISRRTVARWESEQVAAARSILLLWQFRTSVPYQWLKTGSGWGDYEGFPMEIDNVEALAKPALDEIAKVEKATGHSWNEIMALLQECTPRDLNPEPTDSGSVRSGIVIDFPSTRAA